MKSKSTLRWLLLTIVFGSVAAYAWQQSRSQAHESEAAVTSPDTMQALVVVTYFTTNVRCKSCRTIEDLSRRAIEEGFPTEVASGEVVFRVLNTDRPENEHFLDDYEITNKTVIVSWQSGDKESDWTDRQDVWLLLGDPEAFFAYVREPVRRYLDKS